MTTQYLQLLTEIRDRGFDKGDRTGTGTRSLFDGGQAVFNLQDGYPLLTTKKMFTKGVIEELLWFISGNTNIRYLQERKVTIWDEWASEDGELGPVYGKQFRHKGERAAFMGQGRWSGGFDQLGWCIERLKTNPDCRRILMSLWAPEEIDDMNLPPCHGIAIQFWSRELTVAERRYEAEKTPGLVLRDDGRNDDEILDEAGVPRRALYCKTYQRSCDFFLGVPFNIASYALLTHMVAQCVGMAAWQLIYVFGDAHIYQNHWPQVEEQLSREPKKPPRLWLNPEVENIDDFTFDDIHVLDYEHHPRIKAEVSV